MKRCRGWVWLLALALAAGCLTGCQQGSGDGVPPEGEVSSPPVTAAQPPEGALAAVETDSAGLLDIAKQLLIQYAASQGAQLTPGYPRNVLAGGRGEYTAELGFTLSADAGAPGLLAGGLLRPGRPGPVWDKVSQGTARSRKPAASSARRAIKTR